jgi:hypothetical protein
LVLENNHALKAMRLSTPSTATQTGTTYNANVASGYDERYACYVRHLVSMVSPC